MRTFLDTFDTVCYSTRITIIPGVSSYVGSPNFYGSELNQDPLSKTRIPLGSPADPPLDPLFSLQDFPVCVPQDVQLTWPENPTHVLPLMKNALSILGGFGRRLTMYNCVFTQNRAALAGQGRGACTHMHAFIFITPQKIVCVNEEL